MTPEELIEVAHTECNNLLKSEKGYNGISFPEFWAEGYKKGLAEAESHLLENWCRNEEDYCPHLKKLEKENAELREQLKLKREKEDA